MVPCTGLLNGRSMIGTARTGRPLSSARTWKHAIRVRPTTRRLADSELAERYLTGRFFRLSLGHVGRLGGRRHGAAIGRCSESRFTRFPGGQEEARGEMVSSSGSHRRRFHVSMLTLALFVVTLASPIATTSATGASINDDVEKAQASVEITSPPARAESQATTRVRVRETYGKLPLYFEVNRGQSDSRVQFLARGPQQTLFLTSTEAVLVLMKRDPLAYEPAAHGKSEMRGPATGTVLRMAFTGANPTPRVTGLEELPGKANYFVGNDPTRWRASVPTYAKVRYDDLYPGVDLVYYGNQRQLEYDFVVRPGAEPTRIVLHFQGADRLEVDAQGDLVLYAAGHAIRQRKPVIYQEVDGVRKEIRGGYVLKNHHQVGFRLAAYDATRPLVIDPVLVYSTYLGGTGVDSAFGIAVDAAGSAYVTGETLSTDFPTTAGALQPTPLGGINAFATKLNPAGLGSADLVY